MFPPWPSRKILVLQHHNLKNFHFQWVSGFLEVLSPIRFMMHIVLWYSLVKFLDPTNGINRGLDFGIMLSLPTLHPKQRWKRSKGAATAPRNGSVGKLEKVNNKSFEESWRKIIEQGQTWTNHQTHKKKWSFFLVFCFFLAGMPRVGWVLFSHSLFRILQKRNKEKHIL